MRMEKGSIGRTQPKLDALNGSQKNLPEKAFISITDKVRETENV